MVPRSDRAIKVTSEATPLGSYVFVIQSCLAYLPPISLEHMEREP
jgi:hypothetical protein